MATESDSTAARPDLCLGLDLGTTSVKLCLVRVDTGQCIFSTSENSNADVASDLGAQGSEQDAEKIFRAVQVCMDRVTMKNRNAIRCVAITGQMHGMMLWNSESSGCIHDNSIVVKETSNFYTWQDQRATREFISFLPKPDSHQHLATGFGCVTLFWLCKFRPEIVTSAGYDCVGSIQDFLVVTLCGLDRPVMTNQIAASWGYFNTETNSWNSDILKNGGFPVHLLPWVTEAGSVAGSLRCDWLGVAAGTPVLAGMGDVQCAILSAVKQPHDAVLNMSTSCQLSVPLSCVGFSPPRGENPGPVSYFPYYDGRYLAVAASLNGGNVLAGFVKTLKQWLAVFDVSINEDQIWSKLKTLGAEGGSTQGLAVAPTVYRERHCPELGSVSGITQDNLTLGVMYRALCKGLVQNLYQMMPCSFLIENGVTRIVISGTVIEKNAAVQECIKEMYGTHIPTVLGDKADSALGAALVGRKHLQTAGTGGM